MSISKFLVEQQLYICQIQNQTTFKLKLSEGNLTNNQTKCFYSLQKTEDKYNKSKNSKSATQLLYELELGHMAL